MLQLAGPAAASFVLCVLAMIALRPIAVAVDLVDRPGGRKTHHGDVPIVGGLAMFMGLVLGFGLLPLPESTGPAFLAACTILVVIGLIDDRFDLSPWTRLPGQIAATLVLIVGSGSIVTTLGDPLGTGTIVLSHYGSFAFTVVIIIAAINAFNMLDGMDGLAGASALTTLIFAAALSWSSGLAIPAAVCLIVAGAICGFLIFNLPIRFNRSLRCFMGDGGSTLLGFTIAWTCIQVSEGPVRVVSPVTTLWIVALPLYELFWSTIRRIIRGVSPFQADSDHFHHLLLKAGFGVRGAFSVFVGLTILLATVGLLAQRLGASDRASFVLLVLGGIGTVTLMYRSALLWKLVPESLRRLAPLETTPDQ